VEWVWTGQVAEKMKTAILAEDWGTVAMLSAQIAQKFSKITGLESRGWERTCSCPVNSEQLDSAPHL